MDKNGNLCNFWIKYFQDRNQPIPHGKPGSHPSIIKLSKHLCLFKRIEIENGALVERAAPEVTRLDDVNNNNNNFDYVQ